MKRKSLSKAGWPPPQDQGVWPGCFPERSPAKGWRGHGVPILMSLSLAVSRAVVVGTPGERRVPKAGQSKALAVEKEINYGHFAALLVTAKADVSPVGR